MMNFENMPYISDKVLFKAVCYARKLRYEKNWSITKSMDRAARYYGVDISSIARYMGKFASNRRDGKFGFEANFKE